MSDDKTITAFNANEVASESGIAEMDGKYLSKNSILQSDLMN